MEQVFTVPSKDLTFFTEQVTINLVRKSAWVYTVLRGDGPEQAKQKEVTLAEVVAAESLSGAEVTAFKKVLKAIVAAGWDKALTDISVDVI